jgi:diaminopimelate epimerase
MNSMFPNRINIELAKQKSKREFEVIVWERGCGLTLACGTGATAVFSIARKNKIADEEASIFLPGGKILLKENKDGEIIMSGEVETSFSGMTEII